MKNNKKLFFVMALIILLLGLGVASATNDTQDNSISDSSTSKIVKQSSITKNSDTQAITKNTTTKEKTITKKETQTSTKSEAKTIILNNSNYNDYVTFDGYFNDEVNAGDIIDIQGTINKPNELNVNKALHFITSTNDGVLTGANTFRINHDASGSSVEGIIFKNVQFTVSNASDVRINNVSTLNVEDSIGRGIGSVSIRDGSNNITITNSYFKSEMNGGHSNMVFAIAYNCLFENNTVESIGGSVGNIFYLTTYNAGGQQINHNVNITLRNNIIRGIDQPKNLAICFGLMMEGYGHIIENNLIEKDEFTMGIQWTDPEYQGEDQINQTETGAILFRNNTVNSNDTVGVGFKGIVANNTFNTPTTNVGSAEVYNNTFNGVILNNINVFENNTYSRVDVRSNVNVDLKNTKINYFNLTGFNSNVTNINVESDIPVNISGDNNTITNLNLKTSSILNITGSNNIIRYSNITSTDTFAVELNNKGSGNSLVQPKNNTITNNYLVSGLLKGNSAVRNPTNNIVENNTPEGTGTVIVTDETYSDYFDEKGNIINIPNDCVIALSGTFNNKDFIFENTNHVVTSSGVVFNNATITVNGTSKIAFIDPFRIDNRNSEKKNTLIIDSDGNKFSQQINIFDDNSKSDVVLVSIKGNNNEIIKIYSSLQVGTHNETNPNTCGLYVEGSNNYISADFYVHQGPGNYTGVIFTENTRYNTFNGQVFSFYRLNKTGQYGAIISGEGHTFDNVRSQQMTTNDSIPFILNNAKNITINAANLQATNVALVLNNSDNNIIENATYLSSTAEEYPVQLYNSSNNIIRSNFIRNNQTYGGNSAVYEDENSHDNIIIRNTNTPVDLSDETYDELFENGVLINGNIINIVGDLHNRTMIFDTAVTINADNHVIYNSPITINAGTSTINNLLVNATNIPEAITINALTTLNNVKINASEIPTVLAINENTTANTLEINHANQESITKTICLNNARLTSDGLVLNVCGPAVKVDEYDLGLLDYEKDISTIAIYENGSASIRSSGNFIINMNSTKSTTGKLVAIRCEKDTFFQQYSQIANLNININSEADAIGVIGNPEVTGSPVINITGRNVIGLIFNQYYNQSYNNLKLYLTGEDVLGVLTNKTSYVYDSYPAIRNSQIDINATNTAIGAYIRNSYFTSQSTKLTINAPNILGYYLGHMQTDISNHVFTLNGSDVTGIKLVNTTLNERNKRVIEITSNTMNITATTGRAIEIDDVIYLKVYKNNIQTNLNTKSILVEDSTDVNITQNTLINEEFMGNLAVEQANCQNNLIMTNLPTLTLTLTDENYDNYFQNGIYTATEYEKMELSSNLYDKNLTFNSTVGFDGKFYTIYNGTIKVTNNQSVNVSNIIINNTDDRTSSIVVSGYVDLINSTIYQEGDSKQVIVIENSLSGLFSKITYNNITLTGNNGTIFNITRANMNLLEYNNFATIGDRNMIYSHETAMTNGNQYNMRYNNMTVNTTEAVTEIITGSNVRINFIYNNITVNSTQGENKVVIIPGYNGQGTVTDNHIVSEDLLGRRAIDTNVKAFERNTPYSILVLTDDNYVEYKDKYTEYDQIHLGSDLYNKDIDSLSGLIEFDGKGYTIYNGTIYATGTQTVSVRNVNINNSDDRLHSIVSNAIALNLTNNNIYQEGNNKEVISIIGNTMPDFKYNNMIIVGNNNTVFKFINSTNGERYSISYNNVTSTGDENRMIYATHTKNTYRLYITYNNFKVYTQNPVTEIESDTITLIFNNNEVLVNSTHNEKPIVKVTNANARYGQVNNNYIESIDLVGDAAIETNTPKTGNTPTDTTRKVIISITNETLIPTVETNITVSITDMFDNPLNGIVTAKINDEEFEITDNKITYTPQSLGEITVTVTYTDPNSKYETTTETQIISITKQESKPEISTETPTVGETTELTAQFYTDEGIPVTEGKAIFRVNGKTLRDDQGNVIYADVIGGKAIMPDVNITNEWMKADTTIQAVYCGNGEVDPIYSELTTVNVTKPEANIQITSSLEATAGETVTLTASVTDGSKLINSGRVVFKLNGKTLKGEDGKALYVDVVGGVATTTYTIPAKTKAKTYTLTAVFTDTGYERAEVDEEFVISKA